MTLRSYQLISGCLETLTLVVTRWEYPDESESQQGNWSVGYRSRGVYLMSKLFP